MAEDEKNPNGASNIFHSTMKVSVKLKPPKFVLPKPEACPECGLMSDFIPPAMGKNGIFTVNYKCPNGHEFQKISDLK